MAHLFDVDTAVEAREDGYAATVTPNWDALAGVNGGYAAAVCLQALKAALPQPDPLVVSTFFVKRVNHGPVRLKTETIRKGRRVATGCVSMLQGDTEVVRQIASFGVIDHTDERRFMATGAPELPPPDDCVDPLDTGNPLQGITIADQVDYRTPTMPGWMKGEPTQDPTAEFWMRFSDGRDPDLVSLVALVDAAPPATLEIGQLSTTMELTVHLRAHPAPGWLACRLQTRYMSGGFHEEDMELWDSKGELVAQSRQFAMVLD